jgi:hypothetical protein
VLVPFYISSNDSMPDTLLVFNDKAGGSRVRVDTQLIVNGGEMGGDCAQADDEVFCQLRIGQPLRHQAQNLHLAGCQSCGIVGRPLD